MSKKWEAVHSRRWPFFVPQLKAFHKSYRAKSSQKATADDAETVHVTYDQSVVSLYDILRYYFRVIDPLSVNKQGNDVGRQYRTGIYYTNDADLLVIDRIVTEQESLFGQKLAVEVEPLDNYVLAEEYHQDYLKKNPGGYCHINVDDAYKPLS